EPSYSRIFSTRKKPIHLGSEISSAARWPSFTCSVRAASLKATRTLKSRSVIAMHATNTPIQGTVSHHRRAGDRHRHGKTAVITTHVSPITQPVTPRRENGVMSNAAASVTKCKLIKSQSQDNTVTSLGPRSDGDVSGFDIASHLCGPFATIPPAARRWRLYSP